MLTAILTAMLLLCVVYIAIISRIMSLCLDELELSIEGFVVTLVKQQITMNEIVDSATTQVEDVHKALTGVSFELLESNSKTREAGKKMREAHDIAADNIYTTIRTLNKGVKLIKTEIDSKVKKRVSSEIKKAKKLDDE